jgi:hypothetical protein
MFILMLGVDTNNDTVILTEEGGIVGPLLYADDNLTPMALTEARQLQPVLSLYDEYTGVSGLNINISKTMALCVNSSS